MLPEKANILKEVPIMNTYQSVTLCLSHTTPEYSDAYVYISIQSLKLQQTLRVDAVQGKKALAQLMLRLMKMPEVRRYDSYTIYDLHGFLD
jgi:hypothetical protein